MPIDINDIVATEVSEALARAVTKMDYLELPDDWRELPRFSDKMDEVLGDVSDEAEAAGEAIDKMATLLYAIYSSDVLAGTEYDDQIQELLEGLGVE